MVLCILLYNVVPYGHVVRLNTSIIIIIIIISAKWTKWMAEIMRSFDVCFVCVFVCAQRPVMGVKCQ